MTRIAVCYPTTGERVDAIGDYADLLSQHLTADGRTQSRLVPHLSSAREWADATVLQYNPFSYGRRGFAPGLIQGWRRQPGRRILMVHEPFVPITDWRSAIMGGWQRLQLALLVQNSEVISISTDRWRALLPRTSRPVTHLPVPSLLPDARTDRDRCRVQLGLDTADLLVGTLSSSHPSHLGDWVAATLERLAGLGHSIVGCLLGAGAAPLAATSGVRVVRPGPLSPAELAAHVAACDLFLVPLSDGVSTRRTSLMAALQQQVAVVATASSDSDPALVTNGMLRSVDVGRREAFVAAAVSLAERPREREDLALRGRQIYDADFGWDRTVERVLKMALGRARS